MRIPRLLLVCSLAVVLGGVVTHVSGDPPPGKATEAKVRYSRDVLPILSASCFTCHGPDEKTRKAGLRLDIAEKATAALKSGDRAVVPGDLKASTLVARILASGKERMPPAKHPRQLSDSQKQVLQRWIAQGAAFEQHWAFLPPKRPTVLPVKPGWARNPVDQFVQARLEAEKLAPSPEADRYALARRVAIDLTGLPPSLDAVDRFAKDSSSDAYEKFVDRMLASPAFGERWAAVWLDLARYADSNGYANDVPRVIWKYRDWVIGALNRNLPFDQFTREQLAGDLLPNPTQDQIIATGFHRNTLTNDEGGTDREEFRTAAVVDRVNTTLQVWMGLTMACAQCHDHKYDPLRQEEYYQLYALFNQTEDADRGDNSPNLTLWAAGQEKQRDQAQARVAELDRQLYRTDPQLDAAQEKWEKDAARGKLPKNITALLALAPEKRTEAQRTELMKYFRSLAPELKATRDQRTAAAKELAAIKPVLTPILRELPAKQRRKTHILLRGNFLNKGKEVVPGVPVLFHSAIADRPTNRLELANWLVNPANPLTARVAVNRYWEQVFGLGLMETPDDFGVRGKLPANQDLLDWLAVEFSTTLKWDTKKLLKLMVTSATYRQSSKVTAAQWERDPNNRLLSRGPRFRSSAEVIRDQALFAGGLLNPKQFGPPVRPLRPKLGLRAAFGGGTDWDPSPGEDKYRRALYTEWRRTTPYPSMITFDAPSRNVCTVQRTRTNTPLQALTTLNDPVYVEAAQALARRVVKEGGTTVESRMEYAFRRCLTRPPRDAELRKLVELFGKARAEYARDQKKAVEMATQPIGPVPAGLDAVDLAAWTVVGNVLLNLDEVFAKR